MSTKPELRLQQAAQRRLSRGRSVRPRRVKANQTDPYMQIDGAQTITSLEHSADKSARQDTHQLDRHQDPLDTAMRLIGETAHDLRSPLASVSATMQLMRDGQFGDINDTQTSCLTAAIKQCEYIDALASEMLQTQRLQDRMQSIVRKPTKRSTIAEMVTDATSAILARKRIGLLFDADDDKGSDLYVDANIVCRLLVNLITNAQRASHEGGTILVKVVDDTNRGTAHWSVIDCGKGISADHLHSLQDPSVAIDHRDQGSNGLGLLISRQLAALHYSPLTVRSRQGSGTDVMFETPLNHASSVAMAFARFRCSQAPSAMRPSHRLQIGMDVSNSETETEGRETTRSSSWQEVQLGPVNREPQHSSRITISSLTAAPGISRDSLTAVDQLLQSQLSHFEMSYQTSPRTWVVAFDEDTRNVEDTMNRIRRIVEESQHATDNPSMNSVSTVQLAWGKPAIAAVRERTLQSLLIDRMTTSSLSHIGESKSTNPDQDTVRLGTAPIEQSNIASTRLDEELRRLSSHLKGNADRFKKQSTAIRP